MTIALQDDRSAKPFSLQASRVCVQPAPEQSTPDTSASSDELVEHVDGDLLQARALADRHPQSPTSLARLATSELSFGNRVSARAAAERTLKTDTFDAPAMLVAAQTFIALGEISSAEQALQRALDSSDTGEGTMLAASALAARIAAHNGQNQRALALLEQCDDLAGLSLKGSLLAQAGRHHDAIRTLRAALTDTPDSPGALCNLGYAYAAAGSVRKARRATLAATALDPTDRTAGLNLAALLLPEDPAAAVKAIDRLISFHADDLRLERAAAAVLLDSGNRTRALRRLRRLKGSTKLHDATPAEREELNLDILLMSEQRIAPSRAFDYAIQALERCDYRSTSIASLLAATARTSKDLPILEKAYAELSENYERTTLLAVEHSLALIRFDFDRCLEVADEWVKREPFSTNAHIAATYMFACYAGRYKEAAQVGLAVLRRGIRSDALRNNTAFALAMDARPDQAARILPDLSECELALATAGLIEAVRGNIDTGIKMYEECANQLRTAGSDDLAELVSLYQAHAEVTVGKELSEVWINELAERRRSEDPRFEIALIAIERETARARDRLLSG